MLVKYVTALPVAFSPGWYLVTDPKGATDCFRSHLLCHPCSTALALQVVVGLVDVAAVGWVLRVCAALRAGCASSVGLALTNVHDALSAAALLPDRLYKGASIHVKPPAPSSRRSARVVLSLGPGAGCRVQEAALELQGLGAAGQRDGQAGGDMGGSGGQGAGPGAHGGELRPVLAAGGTAAAGAPAVLVRNVWGPGAAEGEPPQVRLGFARGAGAAVGKTGGHAMGREGSSGRGVRVRIVAVGGLFLL